MSTYLSLSTVTTYLPPSSPKPQDTQEKEVHLEASASPFIEAFLGFPPVRGFHTVSGNESARSKLCWTAHFH